MKQTLGIMIHSAMWNEDHLFVWVKGEVQVQVGPDGYPVSNNPEEILATMVEMAESKEDKVLGAFITESSVEELKAKYGVDVNQMTVTIEDYNSAMKD